MTPEQLRAVVDRCVAWAADLRHGTADSAAAGASRDELQALADLHRTGYPTSAADAVRAERQKADRSPDTSASEKPPERTQDSDRGRRA